MENKFIADTGKLAEASLEKGDITGWFEELYTTANGDAGIIPWADQKPKRYLVEWLDAHSVVGEGKRALVIGCGLGDDCEELARRNFQVTGFDISPTAIEWARKRFPESKVDYHVADLFKLPAEWLGTFDFVFECYTIQALPRTVRSTVISQVASLVAPGGELLVVCRGWKDDQEEDKLPWALKREELQEFNRLGFNEISFEDFLDYDDPDRKRFRVLYQA
ncbi:MAG: class I SAM-dependent methyltransferase [bacterium]